MPNDRIYRSNLKAALAQFVTEHMPVADPYTDAMIDAAWKIADRLEWRLVTEYAKVSDEAERRAG
jgi:hypothetical protein